MCANADVEMDFIKSERMANGMCARLSQVGRMQNFVALCCVPVAVCVTCVYLLRQQCFCLCHSCRVFFLGGAVFAGMLASGGSTCLCGFREAGFVDACVGAFGRSTEMLTSFPVSVQA